MFPRSTPIIVVDDMENVRQLVRTSLESLNFSCVTEAEDGKAAYENLCIGLNVGVPFGLIISDWEMPNLSGIDLLQRVRAHPELARTPFLMLTTVGDPQQVVRAVKCGVSDYIVKPFTSEALFKKLTSIWNRQNARGTDKR